MEALPEFKIAYTTYLLGDMDANISRQCITGLLQDAQAANGVNLEELAPGVNFVEAALGLAKFMMAQKIFSKCLNTCLVYARANSVDSETLPILTHAINLTLGVPEVLDADKALLTRIECIINTSVCLQNPDGGECHIEQSVYDTHIKPPLPERIIELLYMQKGIASCLELPVDL